MKKSPFDTSNVELEERVMLYATYDALSKQFQVEPINYESFDLRDIKEINNQPESTVGGALLIRDQKMSCVLLFVKVRTNIQLGWSDSSLKYFKYQIWAFSNLKNDFGRVNIRPKQFLDRIINGLFSIETKIRDDKSFNKAFYFVANEREKAIPALTPGFRALLFQFKEEQITYHILNKVLVAGRITGFNPEYAIKLAKLACKLSTII